MSETVPLPPAPAAGHERSAAARERIPPRGFGFAVPALLLGSLIGPFAPGEGRAAPVAARGDLSGRVLDTSGRLIAGVEVLAAQWAGESHARAARTGPSGRFSFIGLQQAEYRLVATKNGYLAGVARIPGLPADGVEFILRPDSGEAGAEGDMTWVLRLPARDILRLLTQDTPWIEGVPTSGGVLPRLAARVEQHLGTVVAGGDRGDADGSAGVPDYATRFSIGGRAGEEVLWRSGAELSGSGLEQRGTGVLRRTETVAASGGTQSPLGRGAFLVADARFQRQRLLLGTDPGTDESRALGLDAAAHLGSGEQALVEVHVRKLDAVQSAEGIGPSRFEAGIEAVRSFPLGSRHRLDASVSLRRFASDRPDLALLGPGGQLDTPASWLAPEGDWAILSARESMTLGSDLSLSVGADIERSRRSGMGESRMIPALDVEWGPVPGSRLRAGVSWRETESAAADGPGADLGSPLAWHFRWSEEMASGLLWEVAARRQLAVSADPFKLQQGGTGPAGVWTDGEAELRELSLGAEQGLGPIRGRLDCRYGSLSGRIAVPDPFAFGTAPYRRGQARFLGARAGVEVPTAGTEVWIAADRVAADEGHPFTTVALSVSQRLPVPFDPEGRWRLLFDYEGIGGGRPFPVAPTGPNEAQASPGAPMWVGRVSGGVAVRF